MWGYGWWRKEENKWTASLITALSCQEEQSERQNIARNLTHCLSLTWLCFGQLAQAPSFLARHLHAEHRNVIIRAEKSVGKTAAPQAGYLSSPRCSHEGKPTIFHTGVGWRARMRQTVQALQVGLCAISGGECLNKVSLSRGQRWRAQMSRWRKESALLDVFPARKSDSRGGEDRVLL